MKSITIYISEKILINKNSKLTYKYHPKTEYELRKIIKERIKSEGKECNLNDIDVTNITDMSGLFYNSDFNGDISKWDVSNAKDMGSMFALSIFNQDISNWDVSNVENMEYMFSNSKFNKDISKWDVSNVINCNEIFRDCSIEEKYKPNGIK